MSRVISPRRKAIAIRNAKKPRRGYEGMLSPAESLRFKAILQSVIDRLQIAQTLHKPNISTSAMAQWNHDHPSPERMQSIQRIARIAQSEGDETIEFPLINKHEERQTYLRDARMIDSHFVEMINLLSRTNDELEGNRTWTTLKQMVAQRVESKKETEDLLLEICALIEQKKQCETERIDERKEFNKQEATMLRDIEVLEKRCNALRRESRQNLEYEHSLCSAQRSSLNTLYSDEIQEAENEKEVLSKQMADERIIHQFCTSFLDQQHQFVTRSIEDSTEVEKQDIESADRMISEIQESLEKLKEEYHSVNTKISEYQIEEKKAAKRLMEQKQQKLEMERTKQITAHVFNKIIDKFNQKKKAKAAVKKKGKKGKKKKKKK